VSNYFWRANRLSIFYPHYSFKRIFDIPPELFTSNNINNLILDVDNKLKKKGKKVKEDKGEKGREKRRKKKIKMMIV